MLQAGQRFINSCNIAVSFLRQRSLDLSLAAVTVKGQIEMHHTRIVVVSAVHFALYLTSLSSMMLI